MHAFLAGSVVATRARLGLPAQPAPARVR
jgi:hypothetical protein